MYLHMSGNDSGLGTALGDLGRVFLVGLGAGKRLGVA